MINSIFSQPYTYSMQEIEPDIDPTPKPFNPPEYYEPEEEYEEAITL